MEVTKNDFPSVLDSAYKQYQQDLERYKLVKEIMTPQVFTITPEDTMDKAARVMGEKHIGSLIVEKYATPVGIVTERDLLSKVFGQGKNPEDESVEKVMSYPLVGIGLTSKIKEAAQMMVKKKSRLAVLDYGKLMGIITATDLIRSLPEVAETQVVVDDYMTKEVVTTEASTLISDVAKTMGEQRIGSVLVTSKGKTEGIFTERDLLNTFISKQGKLDETVGTHATTPLITVPSGTSIHKAAVYMSKRHIKRLPVEKKGKLVGIITARDLVETYAK
jgi:CBS domain-containing protein